MISQILFLKTACADFVHNCGHSPSSQHGRYVMESDSLKSAIAAATIYNQELDLRLSHTGIVDVALFHEFAIVEDDPNASSVGWLQSKLRVLSARVSSGDTLSLHEPSHGTLIVVSTLEQFVDWADRHFPVAKVRP